mgnify:CR=1 FL=1
MSNAQSIQNPRSEKPPEADSVDRGSSKFSSLGFMSFGSPTGPTFYFTQEKYIGGGSRAGSRESTAQSDTAGSTKDE